MTVNKNRRRAATIVASSLSNMTRRSNTSKNRIAFAKKMQSYLSSIDVNPCLTQLPGSKQMALEDSSGSPVMVFDKTNQIGSASVYGMAHLHRGRHVLMKFASKIMRKNEMGKFEIKMLELMTIFTLAEYTPNFPIMYDSLSCDISCSAPECPSVVRGEKYIVSANELADTDLKRWFAIGNHSQEAYQSVVVQIVLAVYAFHQVFDMVHGDTHLGNFLVHTITPGGYWRYLIRETGEGKMEFFLKNCGYLVVIWDPMSGEWTHPTWIKDFDRPLGIIRRSSGTPKTIKHQVAELIDLLTRTTAENVPTKNASKPVLNRFVGDFILKCMELFPSVVTRTKHWYSQYGYDFFKYLPPADQHILNVKAYLDEDRLYA